MQFFPWKYIISVFVYKYTPLSLFIECQNLPTFKTLPSPETSVILGESISLPCEAEGDPLPKIVAWLFDGKRVDTKSGRHFVRNTGELFISKAEKSDSGFYQCVAQNRLGGIASLKRKLYVTCKFVYFSDVLIFSKETCLEIDDGASRYISFISVLFCSK